MIGDLAILVLTFVGGWFARAHFGTFAEMKKWIGEKKAEWVK
jgi:hypothetical protein